MTNNNFPYFTEKDVDMVRKHASVDKEKARNALVEAQEDITRAMLILTTG